MYIMQNVQCEALSSVRQVRFAFFAVVCRLDFEMCKICLEQLHCVGGCFEQRESVWDVSHIYICSVCVNQNVQCKARSLQFCSVQCALLSLQCVRYVAAALCGRIL